MITIHCPRKATELLSWPSPTLSSTPGPISAGRLSPPPLAAAACPKRRCPAAAAGALAAPADSSAAAAALPAPTPRRRHHTRAPLKARRSAAPGAEDGGRENAGRCPQPRHPDTHSCTAPRGSHSGSRLKSRRLQATRCPEQRQGAGQRAAAGRPPSSSGSRSSAGRTAGAVRGRRSMAGSEPLPALPSLAFPPHRAERDSTSCFSARVAAAAHAPERPLRGEGDGRRGCRKK